MPSLATSRRSTRCCTGDDGTKHERESGWVVYHGVQDMYHARDVLIGTTRALLALKRFMWALDGSIVGRKLMVGCRRL